MHNSHIARALAEGRVADIHREMRVNRPRPAAMADEIRTLPRPCLSTGPLPATEAG
jgi:hypothetical protein